MEVIHDFWRDRTTQSEASPDTAIQALAAETIVEPPTLPPLYANAEGEGVPDMGADGVPAPWQRRQRRRMSLSSASAGPVTPAATANDEAGTDTPPAEGSVSRLAYLRARLAANAARRRMTKRATFVRRALMLTNVVGQRWSSHRLHQIPTHLSQVAVHGVICLLSFWGLGLGALVGGSDCVAMDLSPAACRCVSFNSQGLRRASGQTSPRPGKVTSIVDCMHFHCRYNDAFCHACTLNIGSSLFHSSTYALIFRPHAAMGTSKASKRRQANRPGRRERAADRGDRPAAYIEEQFTEVSQASSTSQLVGATLGFPETSWPRFSGDVSGLTWTTESAAICRHATLVLPIPLQLRASTLGPLANEPAAFSSTDMLSTYVPVPWIRLGRLGRTLTICPSRTPSSRGAVAGYGDCGLLLPSTTLLIMWRIVLRNRVSTTMPVIPARIPLRNSSRLPRGRVLHSAWRSVLRPISLRQKCHISRDCECQFAFACIPPVRRCKVEERLDNMQERYHTSAPVFAFRVSGTGTRVVCRSTLPLAPASDSGS